VSPWRGRRAWEWVGSFAAARSPSQEAAVDDPVGPIDLAIAAKRLMFAWAVGCLAGVPLRLIIRGHRDVP
jgi:hypothetical protein